jgi:hypothetical protein
MKGFKHLVGLLIGLGLLVSIFPPAVQAAYLDPGSGSFIIQLILASLVGISFFVKVFWRNIKLFFSNIFAKKPDQE